MSDDNYEKYQVYVEKEKTRELLNQAMRGPSLTDQWRTYLVITLALAVVGGAFAVRTKRFQEVMTKIEHSIEEKRKADALAKEKPKKSQVVNPEQALASAEKKWQKELEGKEGQDLDLDSEIAARERLGNSLEKVANGDTRAIAEAQRGLSSTGAAKAPGTAGEESLLPDLSRPDTIGIATGEREPEVNAFQITVKPHTADYRELQAMPAQYAREKEEFPDFR